MEHADHLAVGEQRDAKEGFDALLAQDRVVDVGVVDVRDGDRAALGGDPPREALADRDADALLDLLLDPLGGARVELVALSSRIAAVSLSRTSADAIQQLRQELLLGEVRERGVRHVLERLEPRVAASAASRAAPLAEHGGSARSPARRGPRRTGAGRAPRQRTRAGRGCRRAARRARGPARPAAPRAANWIPFSRRIGLKMSAWSTSSMAIARRSAAIRPANPGRPGSPPPARPPPRSPSRRARAPPPSSSRIAAVSMPTIPATRSSSSGSRSPSGRMARAASVIRCNASRPARSLRMPSNARVDGPSRHRGRC